MRNTLSLTFCVSFSLRINLCFCFLALVLRFLARTLIQLMIWGWIGRSIVVVTSTVKFGQESGGQLAEAWTLFDGACLSFLFWGGGTDPLDDAGKLGV
ncbi:hypothetical protein QBC37DRAFT_99978 [Rhypophila decipiens]|uniref:Uncharacterized protein n=1 Tax=Rhypophila decipiens TaxID=261697 RepID=A0AAN6XV65_9PEZI|nr:hypothetical protein QBC37DRAFT_99978 [Rhypophila decipiens]